MIQRDSTSILAHFSILEDPRRNHWNILHPLSEIVTIALCAVLGGAEGWQDIASFGKAKESWFRQRLKLEQGIPSADTFRRVISVIDPAVFADCFLSWVNAVVGKLGQGVVAIDGKTLRGSYDKDDPKAALHMVSAWADSANMILAQYKVDQKKALQNLYRGESVQTLLNRPYSIFFHSCHGPSAQTPHPTTTRQY